MENNNCYANVSCGFVAVVASIIVGVITAFLTITEVIFLTPVFFWVTFGIAVGYLAILQFTGGRGCGCATITTLLIGILGTILLSLILLAIGFVEPSIIAAILFGLLLLFFTLILTTSACYIRCIFCNRE